MGHSYCFYHILETKNVSNVSGNVCSSFQEQSSSFEKTNEGTFVQILKYSSVKYKIIPGHFCSINKITAAQVPSSFQAPP